MLERSFRAIPVTCCAKCPYSNDWSSGGVDCEKAEPKRSIVNGLNRELVNNVTPEWCPLPEVVHRR